MKKSVIKLFSALLVSNAVAVTGNLNKVDAADTTGDTGKNSTASIQINAGNLEIADKKDITFSPVTLNGQNHNNHQENSNSFIKINDFRGATTGWKLSVTSDNRFTDNGINLYFNPKADNSNVKTDSQNLLINNEAQNVAYMGSANRETPLTSQINLNAYLNIPANARANSYETTLTWNLTSDAVSAEQ
ncbi:WxL domain-containing protein [Holzapfeliella sp. He02]|uniref:WxL domain-containing protein n=1 Tax=Holzapfeliella saturejae TaxID=3082953 RepID=A0ABU8SHR4_9LACO